MLNLNLLLSFILTILSSVNNKKRFRPACSSRQSDQHIGYSFSGRNDRK